MQPQTVAYNDLGLMLYNRLDPSYIHVHVNASIVYNHEKEKVCIDQIYCWLSSR